MSFKLIAGVSIPDTSALKKEYRNTKVRILFSLSAEDYASFFREGVKLLQAPIFFFAEIPDSDDQTRLYYLDNCTPEVIQAILKTYGHILYADGVIRFGFGSHTAEEEIYMQDYQTLSIYSESISAYESLLQRLGYQPNKSAKLTWDILSETNAGEATCIEADDETYVDMINNLIDVGMYPAE